MGGGLRGDDVEEEDVIRFDHDGRTYAIYRSPDDEYFATDGLCTHEQAHLADGLVMDDIIECPKHNGRFDYRTGEAKGAPVCVDLRTYPVKVEDGKVFIEIGVRRCAGIVIVGAGECGVRAAFALREAGYRRAGHADRRRAALPYERPPLSKQHPVAAKHIAAEEAFAAAGIALMRGRRITAIDVAGKTSKPTGRLSPTTSC